MPEVSTHPTAQALALFGHGKLSEAQSATVAAHLETCADCRNAIAGLPADSFLGKVRAANPGAAPPPPGGTPSVLGLPMVPPAPLANVPPELANHPKFRIVRELGRGGMGVIYLAEHRGLEKLVALKVISPAVLDNPDALARFHAEVKAAGKLDHQNIARAHDADQAGDLHFIVMEYVEGLSLAQGVERKGPLPVAHACHYARQAALGLQHASEKGMVHRDVKPQNLMLAPKGVVKVLDFGLARLRSERQGAVGLTQADAFMWTPEYVAPEQATDARTADTRADIYSLGCTLYALLTGRPPFQEETLVKLVLAHIEKEPQPLHELRPDVPAELSAVVARMLAKDPAQRYQRPTEVAQALLPFCKPGGKPVAASGASQPPGVASGETGTAVGGETSRLKGPGDGATKPPAKAPAVAVVEKESPLGNLGDAPALAPAPNKGKKEREAAKPAPGVWWKRPALLAGAGAAVLALAVGAWLLAGVIFKTRVKTADGEEFIVGEIAQPGAEVLVDGQKITVAQVLDKQKLLDAQTFWDNRDWDWYKSNIPFFESPDPDLDTTYYYRWELVTKHLTYGSPDSGYSFTEFIDRPFWSGAYGSISCPAGHQLYEVRWLKDPRYARDYARYWLRTPGAQPRRYSTWLADAVWAVQRVHADDTLVKGLLPDLKTNYEGWEKEHFDKDVGLFWQTGHDDGMEFNINSRQTKDIVRGAPGYRPTLNAYLWADALAIARVAKLAGDAAVEKQYNARAAALKENLQKKLWDPKRQFFLHLARQDETADGHTVKALALTYQSGRFAGNEHGREEIGFVPWQFNLPDPGYEAAWKYLMDPNYFYADQGPTTVERGDPLYHLSKTCCWWSGQSWPYATTQTLVALANLLNNYEQQAITRADYVKLLRVYAKTHRKNGKPYLAEACHPDSGSWEGHDSYNHSEHYFHSGYIDLIISGLVGLRPRDDDTLEVNPLAPDNWDYFALDDVSYRGRRVSILWDRTGQRYGRGTGLQVLVDGKKIASAATLGRLTAPLPPPGSGEKATPFVNYAVNNDGRYYPHVLASYSNPKAPLHNANDGNYWYHASPPNRWTCEGTKNAQDWCGIDFGIKRRIHTVKLYLLDDGDTVVAPERIELECWDGKRWVAVPKQTRMPETPAGHRANVIGFSEIETERVRAVFTHAKGGATGLTEFEAWGDGTPPTLPR